MSISAVGLLITILATLVSSAWLNLYTDLDFANRVLIPYVIGAGILLLTTFIDLTWSKASGCDLDIASSNLVMLTSEGTITLCDNQ
jgi:hypothetical protein